LSKLRTYSPEFKAKIVMEAISGRKTIQEIAADYAIGLCNAVHLSVRPDPGELLDATVPGWRQRALHEREEDLDKEEG
jgi:hypothetical protein